MSIENIMYGKPREYKPKVVDTAPVCVSSTIESLIATETQHAGVIAHRCKSHAQHVGPCVCFCGHQWRKHA